MENENEKAQNKIVETYAEDMARVIEDDQGGLVKKIIHEQEEKELEKRNLSPDSEKNKLYVVMGSMLLFLAVLTFVFFVARKNDTAVTVVPQFTPLIFSDKSFFIEIADLTKDKITDSILSEANTTNIKDGGVEGIYLTKNKQIVGLRDFLATIKSSLALPATNLVNDNFLLGVFNQGNPPEAETGKDLFILVKMRSLTDIFENLKSWEDKMFYDLHAFFGVPINPKTTYLLTKDFEDGVIENKNARILYGSDGKIVMMYVFADDNSLVIAQDPEAVREVIVRLSSAEIKK